MLNHWENISQTNSTQTLCRSGKFLTSLEKTAELSHLTFGLRDFFRLDENMISKAIDLRYFIDNLQSLRGCKDNH